MDDEGIGIVLAKATELRSKINICINNNNNNPSSFTSSSSPHVINGGGAATAITLPNGVKYEPDTDDEREVQEDESLLNIHDALESLESQLASLQELQHQQRFEREAALSEIDYIRKMLLNKLKEYKGKDLEVIQEAFAFASESVEHSNDLLLPPYPTRPPRPLVLENGHAQSTSRNGNGITQEAKRHNSKSIPVSQSPFSGLKFLITSAAKMAITVIGVMSILTMAGFEPKLSRRASQSKFLTLFSLPAPESPERRTVPLCPPGKVLVMENGEARCVVKERIEIPFESVAVTPDVTYGCG